MLSTVKKSTAAEPQNLRKGLAFKNHWAKSHLKSLNPLCNSPSNDFSDFKRGKKTKTKQNFRNWEITALLSLDNSHCKKVFLQGSKYLSYCHHSNSGAQTGQSLVLLLMMTLQVASSYLNLLFSRKNISSFLHHFSHKLIICSLWFSNIPF